MVLVKIAGVGGCVDLLVAVACTTPPSRLRAGACAGPVTLARAPQTSTATLPLSLLLASLCGTQCTALVVKLASLITLLDQQHRVPLGFPDCSVVEADHCTSIKFVLRRRFKEFELFSE